MIFRTEGPPTILVHKEDVDLLILLNFREWTMQASNERNADQNEACMFGKELIYTTDTRRSVFFAMVKIFCINK